METKKRSYRILEYALTLFLIICLNFIIPRMMPGDPFLYSSGHEGEIVSAYGQEQIEYFREYYGLDKALHIQFGQYLKDLSKGDLGYSYYYKQDVSLIILKRLKWTALLVITSLALSLLFGTLIGSYSAWKRDSWQDKFLYLTMIVFSEIPSFLLGIVLLVVFGGILKLFPLAGSMKHFATYASNWEMIKDIINHAFLPVITLALSRTGGIYLLVRNSLVKILPKDYIRTARAKGLKDARIRYFHALRNALLPLFTRIGLQLASMIGGAILVESLFAYPGLGLLMREAVLVRDYPLIQGIFLILALLVMTINLLVDNLYKKIDPRLSGF